MASDSAGLRVRVHPSLQSEQIGIIKPGGVISFTDEVNNACRLRTFVTDADAD